MQLRHLRYFVKIVEAGSISRAATIVHVAQPALSQQIAELEDQLGVLLLLRSARGVRPTAAGEVLFREATGILRQIEQLPGIVRSSGGEAEGAVSLGMSSTLAAEFAGRFIEACKAALPKVTLKFSVGDSQSIKDRVTAHALDMAVVFEDELVPIFARRLLYRQRLYLVSPTTARHAASISFGDVVKLGLIVPSAPNVTRSVLDRAFAQMAATMQIVAEADELSSILATVRTGMGHTVLPASTVRDSTGIAPPTLIEPPLHLIASVISSSDFPLTHAGEEVRRKLVAFIKGSIADAAPAGVEFLD